jgi:cytochrome c553
MGSRMRSGALSAALVVGALASFSLQAQEAVTKADPVRGKAISYTCLGCHGVPGYKNAYPNYSVPELKGQHPEYIVSALKEYKSGERSHVTMHSQAEELSEQDMTDIAAYFAGTPLPAGHRDAAQVPQVAGLCVSCHGADGVGITPLYPTLAGQHADYIARALDEYQKGARKNLIMATFVTKLTGEQIDALAEYFSKQQPSLQTLPRVLTRYSAEQ